MKIHLQYKNPSKKASMQHALLGGKKSLILMFTRCIVKNPMCIRQELLDTYLEDLDQFPHSLNILVCAKSSNSDLQVGTLGNFMF